MNDSKSLVVLDASTITAETFAIDREAVAAKVSEYRSLTIAGIDDKKGLAAVRAARLELRSVRTGIENRRKEIKAGAVAFGNAVDAAAKSLTALVEPTETELDAKEKAIAKEIEAISKRRLDERMDKLSKVNAGSSPSYVEALSDKVFEELLADKTAAHERHMAEAKAAAEESARLKREQEEKRLADQAKLEADRIALEVEKAASRDEQQRQAKELAAGMEKLAEQQRQADKLAAEQRAELDQQRQAVETERQRIEAEKRAVEQRAKAESDRLASEEAERVRLSEMATREVERAEIAEAVKPDCQKLMTFADKVAKLKPPAATSEYSGMAWSMVESVIEDAAKMIREAARKLEANDVE